MLLLNILVASFRSELLPFLVHCGVLLVIALHRNAGFCGFSSNLVFFSRFFQPRSYLFIRFAEISFVH